MNEKELREYASKLFDETLSEIQDLSAYYLDDVYSLSEITKMFERELKTLKLAHETMHKFSE